MSISTIIQNPFLVSLYSELDVSWPDGSFAFCRSDNTVYQLMTGVWGPVTSVVQAYVNGTKYNNVFPYFASATVSGGNATFWLTDNGLSTGNAVFKNNVFTNSINLITSDATNQYNYSTFTVGTGNKSLTVAVNKIALSLGIIIFTGAANGTTILLQVSGN